MSHVLGPRDSDSDSGCEPSYELYPDYLDQIQQQQSQQPHDPHCLDNAVKMANQPNSTTTLILDSAESYRGWIKEVERKAVETEVWTYLDPEATNKPELETTRVSPSTGIRNRNSRRTS